MLVPASRAVWLAAAGVPVALGCGLVDDALWIAGPAWIAAILVLLLLDAGLCRRAAAFGVEIDLPGVIEIGRPGTAHLRPTGRPPARLDLMLEGDERLAFDPAQARWRGEIALAATLRPYRRGTAAVRRLHLRWSGPLGLVRHIQVRELGRSVAIVPQISRVREVAMRLFSPDRGAGSAVAALAESAEFHALREFRVGDDRRGISWRQSARHAKLLVRETEPERNRTIVTVLDTGRAMSEPLDDGLPRLDHALNAALMLAYIGLKMSDRVGLFAFAAKPVLASGTVAGTAAFGPLQRLAATLDYTDEETNFTLGFSELSGRLGGRALIVVFTEFADTVGAELMIENTGRLMERHSVLFVVFQDDTLDRLATAAPESADAVARAVVAGTLLAERDVVLARLRRLGADVVEAPARGAGPALIARYLERKRQDRV